MKLNEIEIELEKFAQICFNLGKGENSNSVEDKEVSDNEHSVVPGSNDADVGKPETYDGGRANFEVEPYSDKLSSDEGAKEFPMLGDKEMDADKIIEESIAKGLSEKETKRLLLAALAESKIKEDSGAYKDIAIINNAIGHLIQINARKPELSQRLTAIKQEIMKIYGEM